MSEAIDINELLQLFRARDEHAVTEFNNMARWHGASLEMRLAFAESRCEDTARVLCLVIEKMCQLENRLASVKP